MITGKSNTIGLYILNSQHNPDLTGECSYFYPMLRGILSVAEQRGYALNFSVKTWEEIEATNLLVQKSRDQSNDGMIIVPQYNYYYSFLQDLERGNFPYVLLNPSACPNRSKNVTLDNYHGARLATGHLIDLGHTGIGFINGPANHYDAVVREKGFVDAVMQAGVKVREGWLQYGDFTTGSGYEAMERMLQAGPPPEAIFCANDYMAAGAIRALYAHGYRVPDDVSVVGYDNTDIAASVFPPLTTVENPTFELGRLAMERLLQLIEGQQGLEEIIVQPRLVVRNSCKRKD
ncbi:LacI family DNA-binding transcriptional regulator [Zhaonella formicivorans]|uniref:LacI family DNA-binding transcriptional regulator n=1 Tax=Zhaonella formicivorans TaxID=2528593 RepID=UPI001D0F5399|nr:substrate-binding domain-containing protein [Zhaonella formicivorans]